MVNTGNNVSGRVDGLLRQRLGGIGKNRQTPSTAQAAAFAPPPQLSGNTPERRTVTGPMVGDVPLITPEPITTRVTIAPDDAKVILAMNTNNRTVRRRRVDFNASMMLAGDWEFNGEAIKISADGVLLDGQHRLYAVVKSGVSIETLLVTGLPRSTVITMDYGAPRNNADAMSINSIDNARLKAAMLAIVLNGLDGSIANMDAYSTAEVMRYEENNREAIERSIRKTANTKEVAYAGTPAENAAFHYLFSLVDVALADELIGHMIVGRGDASSIPRRLRDKLLVNKSDSKKMSRNTRHKLYIIAWNKMYEGKPSTLRIVGDDKNRMPRIKGLE